MIRRFQLIRNVGLFDNVSGDASTEFAPITLIYGENGRGKTTLAALFRSVSSGEVPVLVERHRLGAQHPPHVVVSSSGVPEQVVFQNGAWDATIPELIVFDDRFVDDNVYSGLVVDASHRQNLHQLILGRDGIALNEELQRQIQSIEEHNRELRIRADRTIPYRGNFSIQQFVWLPQQPDIDRDLQEAERTLAAISDAGSVRAMPGLVQIPLPRVDVAAISAALASGIDGLDSEAVLRIQAHFLSIGERGEAWSADGMQRLALRTGTAGEGLCPLCDQDVRASQIVADFASYFGDRYGALVEEAKRVIGAVRSSFSDVARGSALQVHRQNAERSLFWNRFCALPEIDWPMAGDLELAWREVAEHLGSVLAEKVMRPLERLRLSPEAFEAVERYKAILNRVSAVEPLVERANAEINTVKERALAGDAGSVRSDIARLRTIKGRFEDPARPLCDSYLTEAQAKEATEAARDAAREALDNYRQGVFPAYETAINNNLRRFNAGYRIGSVTSTNTRGGSACTYNVVISNRAVSVGGQDQEGQPSFRTVLSTGDRTTLALAFFFASLDQIRNLAARIVVVDDPIASMDSNRTLVTVQEMRRLSDRAEQVIVMSHDKPFLCQIWNGTDRQRGAALEVARDANGSNIRRWDVKSDSVTEHDRRHKTLRDHLVAPNLETRVVAESLRFVLEGFIRAGYPDHFEAGDVLGTFQRSAQRLLGNANAPLSQGDLAELNDLMEYANRFHHDTNPAWATAAINDAELVHFTERTIRFARRP